MSDWIQRDIAGTRRQILLWIAGTVVLVLVLVLGFIKPRVHRLTAIDRQLQAIDQQLMSPDVANGGEGLRRRLVNATAKRKRLQQQLQETRDYFHTFREGTSFSPGNRQTAGGRIDFKVALLEARNYLEEIAGDRDITLPLDLGMAETIESDDKTESRMWELAATVKLVEQTLDVGIDSVLKLRPYRPLTYPGEGDELLLIREFPVEITLGCDHEQLVGFLDTLLDRDTFFTLRRLSVENLSSNQYEQLRVTAVCGGGLIRERILEPMLLDPEPEPAPAIAEEPLIEILPMREPEEPSFGITEEGETP